MPKFNYKWKISDGYPANNIEKHNKTVFTTFSCGGGSSMGYKLAGYNVIAANDIDPRMKSVYELNHQTDKYFLCDVRELINRNDLPKVDLLDGSPPCFIAGTLVKTISGYKQINKLTTSDRVVTHNGRFMDVIDVMEKYTNVVQQVKIMGTEVITSTPEHPFYVRKMTKTGHFSTQSFSAPEWVPAKDLQIVKNTSNAVKSQYYVGVNINNKSVIPTWNGVTKTYRFRDNSVREVHENTLKLGNLDFWYFIGRWLGDGWVRYKSGIRKSRHEITICCGKHEKDELEHIIYLTGYNYCITETRTAYKFTISNKELAEFVKQFGTGASNKFVPEFVINLPLNLLENFINGYLSADGNTYGNVFGFTTVSKNLLLGMSSCIFKVYRQPITLVTRNMNNNIIEGRIVNAKKSYSARFRKEKVKQQHFYDDGNMLWLPVRSSETINRNVKVYNLSVKNDESYTVDNIIVHNCTSFSIAGRWDKDWGVKKKYKEGQKTQILDDLFFETIKLVDKIRPKVFVGENVERIVQGKAKKYSHEIIKRLERLGYTVQVFVLNSADMGIPQRRRRVFFIANNLGKTINLNFNEKHITLKEISDENDHSDNLTDTYKKYWDEASIEQPVGKFMARRKLSYDKVPRTATASHVNYHPKYRRELNLNEQLQISSWPSDYDFNGLKPHYVMGMSVPPVMMAYIADEIYKQLLS